MSQWCNSENDNFALILSPTVIESFKKLKERGYVCAFIVVIASIICFVLTLEQ